MPIPNGINKLTITEILCLIGTISFVQFKLGNIKFITIPNKAQNRTNTNGIINKYIIPTILHFVIMIITIEPMMQGIPATTQ